ncbi:hypothetical protein C8J38_10833 [Rhizobium sp. PP-WC-2G-219]|nr:hypothetical protein C8J38_10833 [Rhizobium sp. PP-WC-2G-219]
MSLNDSFNPAASSPKDHKSRAKRLPPFSLRLSADERTRLMNEAAGAPLGAYIKTKLLGSVVPARTRRTGLTVQDRAALAQVLALLGRSRLSSNLNQLAHLANIGALPMTPETEAELSAALSDVRAIRTFLMTALGLKAEGAS